MGVVLRERVLLTDLHLALLSRASQALKSEKPRPLQTRTLRPFIRKPSKHTGNTRRQGVPYCFNIPQNPVLTIQAPQGNHLPVST